MGSPSWTRKCSLSVWLVYLTLSIHNEAVFSQATVQECLRATTCSQCLSASADCYWCFEEGNTGCFRSGSDQRCSKVYSPSSMTSFLKNDSVVEAQGDQEAIQLSPQSVRLNLVPNRPTKFLATFRMSANFPVDLYYLMDLSLSMKDDRNNLISLSEKMTDALSNKTTKLHIGFGAFVDKPVSPFISVQPQELLNPCLGTTDNTQTCSPVYGFKNLLPLTTNTTEFAAGVEAAELSANIDFPEGGFDALMQTLVCTHEIGWRENARRIIVMATDAPPHIAMDGRLAGIIEPNDEVCHTDNRGNYDAKYSKQFDYPSLGQLAKQIQAKIVNLIFAVTGNFEMIYKEIAKILPNSIAGVLEEDSNNIVDLLIDNYEDIFSSVSLETLDVPAGISVEVKPLCSAPVGENQTACSVTLGSSVEFEVTVTLNECGEGSSGFFNIFPSGVDERLKVEFVKDCNCNCGDEEMSSEQCSGHGTLSCGECVCDQGYAGSTCQCQTSDTANRSQFCKRSSEEAVCSGQGVCSECGECQCSCLVGQSGPGCTRYSGRFCQCNPTDCGSSAEGLCSNRGTCQCDEDGVNQCRCDPGYFGVDCQCSESMDVCRSGGGLTNVTSASSPGEPGTRREVCEGHGVCECFTEKQSCRCTDPCYSGDFCHVFNETSYDCFYKKDAFQAQCSRLQGCVACFIDNQNMSYCEEFCDTGTPDIQLEIFPVDELEGGCTYAAGDGCVRRFELQRERPVILYKKELECPSFLWLIGVAVAVFVIGIAALLFWKCFVTIKDNREWKRFEKHCQNPTWATTGNPIFRSAVKTVKNPMYNMEKTGMINGHD